MDKNFPYGIKNTNLHIHKFHVGQTPKIHTDANCNWTDERQRKNSESSKKQLYKNFLRKINNWHVTENTEDRRQWMT